MEIYADFMRKLERYAWAHLTAGIAVTELLMMSRGSAASALETWFSCRLNCFCRLSFSSLKLLVSTVSNFSTRPVRCSSFTDKLEGTGKIYWHGPWKRWTVHKATAVWAPPIPPDLLKCVSGGKWTGQSGTMQSFSTCQCDDFTTRSAQVANLKVICFWCSDKRTHQTISQVNTIESHR